VCCRKIQSLSFPLRAVRVPQALGPTRPPYIDEFEADYRRGNPIELIDGANLVYLLAEHADIEAKIIPPDDWKDPAADMPDDIV
jgi:hypothetical protein